MVTLRKEQWNDYGRILPTTGEVDRSCGEIGSIELQVRRTISRPVWNRGGSGLGEPFNASGGARVALAVGQGNQCGHGASLIHWSRGVSAAG